MSNIGKFQVYYERILSDISLIKQEQRYTNLSKAFTHWFLEKFNNLTEQEIAEAIIDGNGDNGIDAIIISNETIFLYQFKFPDKVSNIDKAIDEKAALKIENGYKKLIANRKPRVANERFLAYWEDIKDKDIFNYKYIFVSYSNDLSAQAKDSLMLHIQETKDSTGNEIQIETVTKKKICDMIDKSQNRNVSNISLKYVRIDPSYNLEGEGNAWSGFASANAILEACKSVMDVIFDENIRLYQGNVPVNEGIKRTASTDDSKFFYFFHNGIVFICDKCQNSTGNQTAKLFSASVVNGCQTIVSLKEVAEANKLRDNIFLPIRIIETSDFDLRAKITEYLNSQSHIRDSYFLANNTFIKELQQELLSEGYFLERLSNEYNYKLGIHTINDFPKEKILQLEKAIQIYVAYYNNTYAATAKRGKNELFDKELIDLLISQISAKRVLEAYKYYRKICEKITLYRQCRRSKQMKTDFLEYLGIEFTSIQEYENIMQQYVFLNTGDLLLLNAYYNLIKGRKNTITEDQIIRIAIKICKEVIENEPKISPSAATKNTSIFTKVQEKCRTYRH